MIAITVKDLLEEDPGKGLNFKAVFGDEHLSNLIATSNIQKPGLLLTDLPEELHQGRIQILGGAEIGYLNSVSREKLKKAIEKLNKSNLPCMVITRGLEAPDFLIDFARKKEIPVLVTSLTSSSFIEKLIKHLEERLAPMTTLHGVCVDVLGIGVLIFGKSGIGKSECALELIMRGHRLVADDVITVRKMPTSILYGMASDVIKYHMEIRGLGIVNIKDLFGITAIREKKQIDIVVEMVQWKPQESYERLGFDENRYSILDVKLPHIKIPVSPGRSVADVVEVAARNQILKFMGYNPTLEFQRKLQDAMSRDVKERLK
jgi:HPr kinase/phosphorylase